MRARAARALRVLWFAAAALIVLFAVLLTATRLLLPLAENFRDDLAAWASEALGHPVSVARISARWYRWGPELALFDVRLSEREAGPVLLRFDEVHIGVDLLAAWGEGRLQPSAIRVIGTRLTVERLADGRLQLQGLGVGGGGGGNRAAAVAWLFSRQHLLLERVDLTLIDRRREPQSLQLSDINLELRNDGDRHRLAGGLRLPEALGRTLSVALDARGLLARPDAWEARLHLRLAGLRLAAVAAQALQRLPPITAGTADLEVWGDLEAGRLAALTGRLDAAAVAVATGGAEPYRLAQAGAAFSWRRQAHGWRLQGSDLRLARDASPSPAGGFAVSYTATTATQPARLDARWDYARIEDLAPPLLAVPALPARWREAAGALAPSGVVAAARLQAQLGEVPQFRLTADLREVGFQPWRKVPGVQGLSGRISADERGGRAQLASAELRVDAPLYFRAPFAAQGVTAELEWARLGAGWGVAVRSAALDDPRAKARGVLEVEWQPEEGAFLDLRAVFADADASDISPYIPAVKLPPATVAWLDRAIVGGRSPRGELLYRGRIKRFPFLENDGRFHIRFEAAQATLDYQPGWPRIEEIAATVEFEEASMRVQARQGTILGAQVVGAEAAIANLKASPVLAVRGDVELPVASGLRFLGESPLGEGFRERLAALRGDGSAHLTLDLTIPLRKGTQPRVAGRLELSQARFASQAAAAALEQVNGRLRFSEKLLESERLRGRLLGGEAELTVKAPLGRYRAAQPPGTVTAQGRAEVRALTALLGEPLTARRASGAVRWEASLQLPRREGETSTLTVASDLRGAALDLPPPLGKAAGEARTLRVAVDWTDAARRDVALRYGDAVDAKLRLQSAGQRLTLERGEVRLGGARARMPGEPGLTVAGDLPELAVAEWRAALGGWGKRWDLGGGVLQRIVLRIGTLRVVKHRIDDVRLALAKGQGYWEGSVNGEGAKGYVRMPFRAGEAPVLLRFDHLRLARDADAQAAEADAWPDPQRTPPIDVTVAELQLNGEVLGRLALRAVRVSGGMRITRFLVQGENLQFDASGEWLGDARASRSAIDMRLESADLGRLLKALAYAEGVKNGRTLAEAQLTWPGPPVDPDLPGMTGRVALSVTNGRLVDIEPGAGRIFGLLSFQALPRRLILDFRDIFLKGFSFDAIKGDFRIHSGDAYSDNLRVAGPAARIEIVGRTGLAQRDYDQLVTVIPNVTGGLPLAGWAAGGPTVGAVMLFFQKMFGKRIDESSGIRYRVTGGWDDPRLEKLTPPATRDADDLR